MKAFEQWLNEAILLMEQNNFPINRIHEVKSYTSRGKLGALLLLRIDSHYRDDKWKVIPIDTLPILSNHIFPSMNDLLIVIYRYLQYLIEDENNGAMKFIKQHNDSVLNSYVETLLDMLGRVQSGVNTIDVQADELKDQLKEYENNISQPLQHSPIRCVLVALQRVVAFLRVAPIDTIKSVEMYVSMAYGYETELLYEGRGEDGREEYHISVENCMNASEQKMEQIIDVFCSLNGIEPVTATAL